MKKIFLTGAIIIAANSAQASENLAWKIVPTQSKIEFKVLQDKSIVSGSFKKFDGKINFDKNQLAKSKVTIDIDTSSVNVSMSEAASTIQSPDWLSTKAFPKATFSADQFNLSGKTYRANGTLTIKGKAVPTTLEFTFGEYSSNKAHATGKALIKRSAFDVGSSDVKKANGVKDEVEINFVITAEK